MNFCRLNKTQHIKLRLRVVLLYTFRCRDIVIHALVMEDTAYVVKYNRSTRFTISSIGIRLERITIGIDTRSWYFGRLQPRYDRLHSDLENLSGAIYRDLEKNSATFERGFYRSVIPGIVAVGVGLLLVVMLLFFLLAFYVNPLYRMLDGLDAYRAQDKKYSVKFDGDDQLSRLNEGITELANENRQFRSRIKTIGRK